MIPVIILQVGVELGHDSIFHSVFACPILRRHVSENNPPMKLSCGHVVSKDAITQLYTGQRYTYCVITQTSDSLNITAGALATLFVLKLGSLDTGLEITH